MSLESLWDTIPIGKENSASYDLLSIMWGMRDRTVRKTLHLLSTYDNGDDYVLIRTSRGKGFYRTNDKDQIAVYRRECLNRGRNTFAPLKKIDRVLNADTQQYNFTNNLRVVREGKGMTQREVCEKLSDIDETLLSKMENGVVLPSPTVLHSLSRLYGTETHELVSVDLYQPQI